MHSIAVTTCLSLSIKCGYRWAAADGPSREAWQVRKNGMDLPPPSSGNLPEQETTEAKSSNTRYFDPKKLIQPKC